MAYPLRMKAFFVAFAVLFNLSLVFASWLCLTYATGNGILDFILTGGTLMLMVSVTIFDYSILKNGLDGTIEASIRTVEKSG